MIVNSKRNMPNPASAADAAADTAADTVFAAPFRLDGARSHVLAAASVAGSYRIDLYTPSGAAPQAGWPLLLLLDADGSFATAVEAVRRMGRRPDATGVAAAVVAGVSALDPGDARSVRRRDFTSPGGVGRGGGGAPGFARFLEAEVLPLVDSTVPLDRARRTLFGHSLSGYFALWLLANRPGLFRDYAAVSPSIWWDPPGLRSGLAALAGSDRRALVLMGEWEDRIPPWQLLHPGVEEVRARRAARRLLENARETAALLADVLGEGQARFELLADEDHASIVSAAIPRALRMAARP